MSQFEWFPSTDTDDPVGFPVRVIVTRDLVLEPYGVMMAKLRLGPIADERPVKITIEGVAASGSRDLCGFI